MTAQQILLAASMRDEELVVMDETLHLSADGKIVPADDIAARFLLVAAGSQLPVSLTRKLGIDPATKKAVADRQKAEAERVQKRKEEDEARLAAEAARVQERKQQDAHSDKAVHGAQDKSAAANR